VVILIHVKITKNKDRINYLIQPAQSPSTSSTLFNTRINPPLAPPRRGALSRNFFNPLQHKNKPTPCPSREGSFEP
jgi:hypothetical protein